jgi:hypothetical protein
MTEKKWWENVEWLTTDTSHPQQLMKHWWVQRMMEIPPFLDDHLQYDGKPVSMPSMIFCSANHSACSSIDERLREALLVCIQCLVSMKQQSSDSNQQLIGYITILAHTSIILYIYNYQIYQYIMYFIPWMVIFFMMFHHHLALRKNHGSVAHWPWSEHSWR